MALNVIRLAHPDAPRNAANVATRTDRMARGVILIGGLAILGMLAWGHLGLGALLVPPRATAAEQTAQAGSYVVTLRLISGQLTARGPNSVSLVVRDHADHPVAGAQVRISPAMVSMVMLAPVIAATTGLDGRSTARPIFGMAGPWRLSISITPHGQRTRYASFAIGVRWN